jgi:hypothetical protein
VIGIVQDHQLILVKAVLVVGEHVQKKYRQTQ